MPSFRRIATRNVGDTDTTIFTATSKTIVIGLNIANIYGNTLPVSVWHTVSGTNTYLLKNYRVNPGETKEVTVGNKVVLQTGDVLKAITVFDNAFDIYVSVLEDLP
jgi:hypothetical protein